MRRGLGAGHRAPALLDLPEAVNMGGPDAPLLLVPAVALVGGCGQLDLFACRHPDVAATWMGHCVADGIFPEVGD